MPATRAALCASTLALVLGAAVEAAQTTNGTPWRDAATGAVHAMLTKQLGLSVTPNMLSAGREIVLSEGRFQVMVHANMRQVCAASARAERCPDTLDIDTIVFDAEGRWVAVDMRIDRANGIDVGKESLAKQAIARGDIEEGIRLMRESMSAERFAAQRVQLRTYFQAESDKLRRRVAEDAACSRSARASPTLTSTEPSSVGRSLSQCESGQTDGTTELERFARVLAALDAP